MKTEPDEAPVDLEVLRKDVSEFIRDEEALLRELHQHILNTELLYNLKAENKKEPMRVLVAKIKMLWEKICER